MIESMFGECRLLIHLTTELEILLEKAFAEEEPHENVEEAKEYISHEIEDFENAAEPVIHYYDQFGKLRELDCGPPTPEVFQNLVKCMFPQVFFVIGPICSGKTELSTYLADRTNMTYLNFQAFAAKNDFIKIRSKPELIVQELIKRLRSEPNTRVIIDNFPESLKQMEFYCANAVVPHQVIYINATEDACLRNSQIVAKKDKKCLPLPKLMKKIKEFKENYKDILALCSKYQNLLKVVENTEKTTLKQLREKVANLFCPNIILGRCHEKSQEVLAEMTAELGSKDGYLSIDIPSSRREECSRRTRIGQEMLQYVSQGKIVPSECIVKMLKKLIFSGSDVNKFILTGFPEEVAQLQLFEESCAAISWEFYFYPQDEEFIATSSASCIETYMQSDNRLTIASSFKFELMEQYYGLNLQYVLINGPQLSGKSTIAKEIADQYGYTLVTTASLTEEVKNKKKNPEDEGADPGNVTFQQIIEQLVQKVEERKPKEKFVLDILPQESEEQVVAILEALGRPSHHIELALSYEEVKGRYKIVNQTPDLTEEILAQLDKTNKVYEAVKNILTNPEEGVEIKPYEIKASSSKEKMIQEALNIFELKIVLIKFDGSKSMELVFSNLSIKYGYLYLNTTSLIKQHIENKTALGKELEQRRKPRELRPELSSTDEFDYCAVHFDLQLVIKVLKEAVYKYRTSQKYIVISGILNAHKLANPEDKAEIRPIDEMFTLGRNIGNIQAIISLSKDEYDKIEDIRKPEFPPKPEVKVEIKKEPVEGEETEQKEENQEEGDFLYIN